MKLWLLRPIDGEAGAWDPWYDKAFGFVVRAQTEQEARELLTENGECGDEVCGVDNPWLASEQSSCIELRVEGKKEIIIRDFAAA